MGKNAPHPQHKLRDDAKAAIDGKKLAEWIRDESHPAPEGRALREILAYLAEKVK